MVYLSLRVENHMAIITMNKPPGNSLNLQMYRKIRGAFLSINKMDNIRVVILMAEGNNFSYGNDIKDFLTFDTADKMVKYARVVNDGMYSPLECHVPVIGAVRGMVVGAGFALVSCCDIIIASENSKFTLPEIKVGIVGGACFLSRIIPQQLHRYMAYSGDVMTAEQLKHFGVVLKVVHDNQLLESAIEIAKCITKNSPLFLKAMKSVINKNENDQLKSKYMTEIKRSAELVNSEDFREATNAFLEKRIPIFKGI